MHFQKCPKMEHNLLGLSIRNLLNITLYSSLCIHHYIPLKTANILCWTLSFKNTLATDGEGVTVVTSLCNIAVISLLNEKMNQRGLLISGWGRQVTFTDLQRVNLDSKHFKISAYFHNRLACKFLFGTRFQQCPCTVLSYLTKL